MRVGLIIFFLGCLIFLGGCGSAGGGGGGVGNLHGTVVDLVYSPVSNADVVVDTSSTKTLSNGTYSFTNIPSGVKIIRITAPALTPSYRKVTFSGGTSANAGISFLADLDSKVTPIPQSMGGTATNTTGSIKMVFPAGSVTSDPTNVVLTTVPKIAAPYNPPESDQFVSYIVYAKPDSMTLSSSAELSVPNLTQVPSTVEVTFYKFNTNTLVWESLPGHGHSTTETNTIDFFTNQMGWIAAIMPIYPAPGWIVGTVTSSGVPLSGVNVWTMTSYAVTDSTGNYRLDYIPEGTAEVFASALGYRLYTSPVQTIHSNAQTTLPPIDLTSYKIAQGNIEGSVRDLYDGIIPSARVVETNGGVAYTDEYGRYTLYNVPAGPTDVTAYADNHVSSTESGVSVPSGNTVSISPFELPPTAASASTYEFTFEAGTQGFTNIADRDGHNFWHRQSSSEALVNYFNSTHEAGVTRKVYLKDDGRIPNAHGGNYYFWYGQASPTTVEASYIGAQDPEDIATPESGTGGLSAVSGFVNGNSGTLESPALDLKGYTYGKLSFWTWWEIEGKNPGHGGYDAMYIYISKDPYDSWTFLGYLNPYEDPSSSIKVSGEAYTSGGFDQPGLWVQHNYDLTPYAGSVIKIRFVFNTFDRLYNGFRGWFLDDIKVENSQFGLFSVGENAIGNNPSLPRRPRN